MFHKGKLYVYIICSLNILTSQNMPAQTGWFHNNFALYNRDIMLSIQFVNPNSGYAVGASGTIMKTTNAGLNWTLQTPDSSGIFYSVFFADANTGYIGGLTSTPPLFKARVLKTTNGGQNWNIVLTDGSYWIYSLCFTNANTGYAVGRHAITIQYSENNYFSVVQFVTPHIGYIAPYGSYILKTTTGGVLTGFSSVQNELAKEYYLSQNYPNPFNPTTVINYEIPLNVKGQTSNVKLVVYNALGIEIATLVNENQNSGNYQIEFDGSNLSSGIYFYKLTTGDFSDVKKMTLLK